MVKPSYPGINYQEDSSLSGNAPRPPITDSKAYMQSFVDRYPDSPLTARIISFYGVRPTPGYGTGGIENSVRVQTRGTPGQDDYTVTHGPIAAPRGRPQNEQDPFFQENYGVNDNISPWLIQPQQMVRESGLAPQQVHRYGIPAASPIALPPQQQQQPKPNPNPLPYLNDRWGNN